MLRYWLVMTECAYTNGPPVLRRFVIEASTVGLASEIATIRSNKAEGWRAVKSVEVASAVQIKLPWEIVQ